MNSTKCLEKFHRHFESVLKNFIVDFIVSNYLFIPQKAYSKHNLKRSFHISKNSEPDTIPENMRYEGNCVDRSFCDIFSVQFLKCLRKCSSYILAFSFEILKMFRRIRIFWPIFIKRIIFPEKRSVCMNCGRDYKYKSTLNRHLKYECGDKKNFECPICGKLFAQKCNYKTHLGIMHKVISH